MIGIGTPNNKSKIERIEILPFMLRSNRIRLITPVPSYTVTTLSRCRPPMVAEKLAQNAPMRRAKNIHRRVWAVALRAASIFCWALGEDVRDPFICLGVEADPFSRKRVDRDRIYPPRTSLPAQVHEQRLLRPPLRWPHSLRRVCRHPRERDYRRNRHLDRDLQLEKLR